MEWSLLSRACCHLDEDKYWAFLVVMHLECNWISWLSLQVHRPNKKIMTCPKTQIPFYQPSLTRINTYQ
jgi:hypothetical protein